MSFPIWLFREVDSYIHDFTGFITVMIKFSFKYRICNSGIDGVEGGILCFPPR